MEKYPLSAGAMSGPWWLKSNARPAGDQEVAGCRFNACWVGQHSFMEINCEIFSTVILILLIQIGEFSVSGQRMSIVNHLED